MAQGQCRRCPLHPIEYNARNFKEMRGRAASSARRRHRLRYARLASSSGPELGHRDVFARLAPSSGPELGHWDVVGERCARSNEEMKLETAHSRPRIQNPRHRTLPEYNGDSLLVKTRSMGLRAPRYAHVRFHPASGSCRIYTTVNIGKDGGYLFKWSVGKNWKPKMICKRKVATEAVNSFAVSHRGDLLAIGNNFGDLLVVSGGGMYPLQKVKDLLTARHESPCKPKSLLFRTLFPEMDLGLDGASTLLAKNEGLDHSAATCMILTPEKLLRSLSDHMGFQKGNPVAAVVIIRAWLQWKSFQADKTSTFDRIIQAIGEQIEERQDDNNAVAYCLWRRQKNERVVDVSSGDLQREGLSKAKSAFKGDVRWVGRNKPDRWKGDASIHLGSARDGWCRHVDRWPPLSHPYGNPEQGCVWAGQERRRKSRRSHGHLMGWLEGVLGAQELGPCHRGWGLGVGGHGGEWVESGGGGVTLLN
ncbi:hypothetical protein BSKO_02878 [Bryopsis sp. KO-2023]|nr:hypothetical protein BSKO_02878 [Bryopsis sp. KO-2023]